MCSRTPIKKADETIGVKHYHAMKARESADA
jgi:hypothetical protein